MGCAADIAFAREGAEPASAYYPTKEEGAREVVESIQKTGLRIWRLRAVFATTIFARNLWPKRLRDCSSSICKSATRRVGRRAT